MSSHKPPTSLNQQRETSSNNEVLPAQPDGVQTELTLLSRVSRENTAHIAEGPAVKTWLQEEYVQRLREYHETKRSAASIEKRLPREQRGQHGPEQLIAIAAAVDVEKKRRVVLTEIGLIRFGNSPFDHLAQLCLPEARTDVEKLSETELMFELSRHLGSTGMQYKKIIQSSLESRREEVAWELAREKTREKLIAIVASDATREEIDAAIAKLNKQPSSAERTVTTPKDVQVIDEYGRRLPAEAFFKDRGESPFTIEEWASLPIRPVLAPHCKPGKSPAELAEFLFERVIYSPQVCDRQGSAVGLSEAKRQQYIEEHCVLYREWFAINCYPVYAAHCHRQPY